MPDVVKAVSANEYYRDRRKTVKKAEKYVHASISPGPHTDVDTTPRVNADE